MAAEWLRAEQVAAIRDRWRGECPWCAEHICETGIKDIAQLAAQDGRWRALVSELLAALGAIGGYADESEVDYAIEAFVNRYAGCAEERPTTQRIYAALAQAQAALADAPGEA